MGRGGPFFGFHWPSWPLSSSVLPCGQSTFPRRRKVRSFSGFLAPPLPGRPASLGSAGAPERGKVMGRTDSKLPYPRPSPWGKVPSERAEEGESGLCSKKGPQTLISSYSLLPRPIFSPWASRAFQSASGCLSLKWSWCTWEPAAAEPGRGGWAITASTQA